MTDIAASSSPRPHLPALDGLRGVAILLVMIHHFGGGFDDGQIAGLNLLFTRVVGVGWCGVDLFFVLSGFLITGILLDARGGSGTMRNFYARRVLRIFPLYYGLLLVLFVLLPAIVRTPTPGIDKVGQSQGWLWLYCSNIATVFASGEPFSGGLVQTGHFWTLAIEEQFYLVWPLCVFVLRRRSLAKLCVGVMIVGLALRIGLAASGFPRIAFLTPCRLDGLMAGALLALALRSRRGIEAILPFARPVAWTCGISLAVIAGFRGFSTEDRVITTAGFTLLAGFFAATTTLALAAPSGALFSRFLQGRTLTFFGNYSYGLYVLHFALKPTFQHFFSPAILADRVFHHYWPARFAYMAMAIAASTLAAWLSWHLYEKQFLKLKRFFPAARPSDVAPVTQIAPTAKPMAQAA